MRLHLRQLAMEAGHQLDKTPLPFERGTTPPTTASTRVIHGPWRPSSHRASIPGIVWTPRCSGGLHAVARWARGLCGDRREARPTDRGVGGGREAQEGSVVLTPEQRHRTSTPEPPSAGPTSKEPERSSPTLPDSPRRRRRAHVDRLWPGGREGPCPWQWQECVATLWCAFVSSGHVRVDDLG